MPSRLCQTVAVPPFWQIQKTYPSYTQRSFAPFTASRACSSCHCTPMPSMHRPGLLGGLLGFSAVWLRPVKSKPSWPRSSGAVWLWRNGKPFQATRLCFATSSTKKMRTPTAPLACLHSHAVEREWRPTRNISWSFERGGTAFESFDECTA